MSSEPVELKCSRCGHAWRYSGSLSRYGTVCPSCKSWVAIPKHLRRIPPSQKVRKGVSVSCPRCGHEWVYSGAYLPLIYSGKVVIIMCPACGKKIRVRIKQQVQTTTTP
jgi:RNase P subunit RPR2